MLTIRDSDAQSISDFIDSLWHVIDLQSEIVRLAKAGQVRLTRAVMEGGENTLADQRRKLSVMQEQHGLAKEIDGTRLLQALIDPATKMGSWVRGLKEIPSLPAELAEKIEEHNHAYDSLMWPGEVVSRRDTAESWKKLQARLREEGTLPAEPAPSTAEETPPPSGPAPFTSRVPEPNAKPSATDDKGGGSVVQFDPNRFGRRR